MLAERAASEGPRWTRAVGIIPPTPYKVTFAAALLWAWRVSARRGWVGKKSELFEHSAWGSPLVLYIQALDGVLYGQKLVDPALMRIRLNIVRDAQRIPNQRLHRAAAAQPPVAPRLPVSRGAVMWH